MSEVSSRFQASKIKRCFSLDNYLARHLFSFNIYCCQYFKEFSISQIFREEYIVLIENVHILSHVFGVCVCVNYVCVACVHMYT